MKTLILCSLFLASAVSWGDSESSVNSVSASAARTPKWHANFTSFYINMEGEKAADSNLYDFGKLSSRFDLLNLSYDVAPKWTVSVLLQHYDSYIESLFPLAPRPDWKQSNDRIEGMADTSVTAARSLVMSGPWILMGDFGVSLPTGAIDNKATELPGLENINLAYNAQLGSGTFDLLGGMTLLYLNPQYTFGSRLAATIHTGHNTFTYRLGNHYRIDGWFEHELGSGFAMRITSFYRHKNAVEGFDETRGNNPGDNFYYNAQKNWEMATGVRYSKKFRVVGGNGFTGTAELGLPLAQNSINADNAQVYSKFYGSVGLNATF